MPRATLLSHLAILICIIAALQITATYFYLYWIFWWYDIFMHLLGGAFVGLLVLWLRFFSGYFGIHLPDSKASVFFFTTVLVLIIGVGWEAFERVLGQDRKSTRLNSSHMSI